MAGGVRPRATDWTEYLGPYVGDYSKENLYYAYTGSKSGNPLAHPFLRCPSGRKSAPPFSNASETWPTTHYNCFIGIAPPDEHRVSNRRRDRNALYCVFGSENVDHPPVKVARIKKPSEALVFLDTVYGRMSTPIAPVGRFDFDADGDTRPDTNRLLFNDWDLAFNRGRPTVHNRGSNVTLADGHVERVAYEKLWNVDEGNNVTHPFWYIE